MSDSATALPPTAPAVLSAPHHFEAGWQLFRAHWRRYVIAVLAVFAAWVVLEFAVVSLQRLGPVANVVLHVAFALLASGMVVGIHRMALDAVHGRAPSLESLIAHFDRGPAYLLAWCMYSLAVATGLVLLAAPGVLVAVRHGLFAQVLAERRVGGYEALRLAGALSALRWWAMFRLFALALAFNLAGAAFLGVGVLVTIPVSILACTSLYAEIASSRAPGAGA
jgi:hypothetical protein